MSPTDAYSCLLTGAKPKPYRTAGSEMVVAILQRDPKTVRFHRRINMTGGLDNRRSAFYEDDQVLVSGGWHTICAKQTSGRFHSD
jgi:hypothetical protein